MLWPLLLLYSWLIDPVFARRLSIAMAASLLDYRILKELFGTARPFETDPQVSCPAERTASVTGFQRHRRRATSISPTPFIINGGGLAAAVGIVVAAGTSRVYLRLHLPEDVGGGFILGAIFAWAAGGWAGPRFPARGSRYRRRDAGAAFAVGAEPGACGLLAGCAVSPSRLYAAADGARPGSGSSWAASSPWGSPAGLLYWLPGRLFPGLETSSALAYLLYLTAAIVGFGLWPRLWQILVGRPSAQIRRLIPWRPIL